MSSATHSHKANHTSNKNLSRRTSLALNINTSVLVGIEDFFTNLLKPVCQSLSCKAIAVYLANDNLHGELLIQKADRKKLQRIYPIKRNVENSLLEMCFQQNSHTLLDENLILPDIPNMAIKSTLCTPLQISNKVLGVAAAFNKQDERKFTRSDRKQLQTLAISLAYTLEKAWQLHQLQAIHHKTEEELEQVTNSRDSLQALLDKIPTALYVIDTQYKIVAANMQLTQQIKQPASVIKGQICYQSLYQREKPCEGCLVHETLSESKNTSRIRQANSTSTIEKQWEVGSYPIYDKRGKVSQAILVEQDVTERHRLESIVAQSEQLAAIGQLAAGVAHEINNPLTAILANAQLLQREISPNDDKQELVAMISEAGERAAQVVRGLLDLARREQYEFLPTDINETIRKAIELIRHEIVSKSIRLYSDLNSTLPLIQASQNHLQGVWVNLLLNAVDALDNTSGKIGIASHYQGDEAVITVTDTGKGMSPEEITSIFDPFYTTKAAGHGTGLGLSVCERVVKKHHGQILVKSKPGQGTEVMVKLPVMHS